MSDMMSAIQDDIDSYRLLCQIFGEEVQYKRDFYGVLVENCYGEHALKLKERNNNDSIKHKL